MSNNTFPVSEDFRAIRQLLCEEQYPLIISARRSTGDYNGYHYDNLVITTIEPSVEGIYASQSRMPFARASFAPSEYVGRHARLSYDRFGKLLSIEFAGKENH